MQLKWTPTKRSHWRPQNYWNTHTTTWKLAVSEQSTSKQAAPATSPVGMCTALQQCTYCGTLSKCTTKPSQSQGHSKPYKRTNIADQSSTQGRRETQTQESTQLHTLYRDGSHEDCSDSGGAGTDCNVGNPSHSTNSELSYTGCSKLLQPQCVASWCRQWKANSEKGYTHKIAVLILHSPASCHCCSLQVNPTCPNGYSLTSSCQCQSQSPTECVPTYCHPCLRWSQALCACVLRKIPPPGCPIPWAS